MKIHYPASAAVLWGHAGLEAGKTLNNNAYFITELATQPCGHVTKTLVINLFTMSKSRTRNAAEAVFRNFFLKW